MSTILDAGIDFILFIQAMGTPAADRFFEIITGLGAMGYLLLVPLVLWCVDFRLGLRVALAMAATLFVNSTLKEWIGLDRPFLVDERIVSAGERGLAMPSGHAQLVVVYWGLLALWVGRRSFWAFAIMWMFLMGLSRCYLGVHYPSDVVVGWAIGAATVWVFAAQADRIEQAMALLSPARLAAAAGAIALLVFAFDALAVADHTHTNPGIAGWVFGAVLGGEWTRRRGVFVGNGAAWQRALRLVAGFAMGLPLLAVLRELGAPDEPLVLNAVVALDLAIFGFWMTGLAPWVFERIWLARVPDDLGEAY